MAAKEKMPVAIYQLNAGFNEEEPFEEVINELVAKIRRRTPSFNEEECAVRDHDFSCRVYSLSITFPPKWVGFIDKALSERSDLRNRYNTSHSFVAFIGFNEKIFVITGGSGSRLIDGYVDQNFGLEVLSRLIDRDSSVIKSIHDRTVTGNVLGQSQFYRGNQRFSDQSQFGKVFQKVKAELELKILAMVLGIPLDEIRGNGTSCLAKNSFLVGKSVDFDQLLVIVRKLDALLALPPKFELNKVQHITVRKNRELVKALNEQLIITLYKDIKSGQSPDVDFCHREFEKFLTANSFVLQPEGDQDVIEFDKAMSFMEIISKIKDKDQYCDEDEIDFKHYVLWRELSAFDEDGVELTNGTILDHIHCEIQYNGSSYFYLDKEWYKIHSDYIKDLNTECKSLLDNFLDRTMINEPFDISLDEGAFNLSFINKPNTLVFDTIVPENIEPCDILFYGDKHLHLVHVKKGFNNSIRDLASQVVIAAKRLREDIKSNFYYIQQIENALTKRKKSASAKSNLLGNQTIPAGGLKEVFKKKNSNIFFCLAFADNGSEERDILKDLHAFNSNIAKFSLLELKREIIGMDFQFKVIQLNRRGQE